MTDAFISYSRKDKGFVRRLFDALSAGERDLWVDWEDIPYSAEWWEEIRVGIEGAEAFVFVLSPGSFQSRVCNEELAYARELNKRIVPVVRQPIDEVMVAAVDDLAWGEQACANWTAIGRINWLFCRRTPECACAYDDPAPFEPERDGPACDADDFEAALAALLTTLDTDLSHVKTHTRLTVRATEWADNQRNPSFLLRGDDLDEAEAWLGEAVNKEPRPSPLQVDYITLSRHHERQRQRRLLSAAVAAVSIMAVLAGLSFLLFRQSEQNLDVANVRGTGVAQQAATAIAAMATSERRADEAQTLLWANDAGQAFSDGDPLRALALAVEANRIPDPPTLAQLTLADVAYNSAVRQVLQGHTDLVSTAAWSSQGDTLLTGSWDGMVILWDAATGQMMHRWESRSDRVSAVAFAPDGMTALTAGKDGTLIRWDLATSTELWRADAGGEIDDLAVSPDGRYALTGADTYLAVLWDMQDGSPVREYRGHEHFVSAVAFSPNGEMIATGSFDETIGLWSLETGELKRQWSSQVTALAFSPDGKTLLSGTRIEPSVVLWDVETGEEIRRFSGHTEDVQAVAFSPDGRWALSVSGQEIYPTNEVILWDVAMGTEVRRYVGHRHAVLAAAFNPDGTGFVTASRDGTAIVWDVMTGAMVHQFVGHIEWVLDAALSPDGTHAVSLASPFNGPSEMIFWDVTTGSILWRRPNLMGELRSVDFARDGRRVIASFCQISGTYGCVLDGGAVFRDAASGDEVGRFTGHYGDAVEVAYSSDGGQVLTAGTDGFIAIWDVASGDPIQVLNGDGEALAAAAISPDGELVLSSSEFGDHSLILWDVATGREVRRFEGHADRVLDVAFSPDGALAASASADDTIIVWNVGTGQPVRRLEGHTDDATGVAFAPNGRMIAASSNDGTILIWDTTSGALLRRLAGHSDRVTSVEFSADGQRLLSASWDGTLILWRMDDLEALLEWTYKHRSVRELTCDERRDFNVTPLCDGNG